MVVLGQRVNSCEFTSLLGAREAPCLTLPLPAHVLACSTIDCSATHFAVSRSTALHWLLRHHSFAHQLLCHWPFALPSAAPLPLTLPLPSLLQLLEYLEVPPLNTTLSDFNPSVTSAISGGASLLLQAGQTLSPEMLPVTVSDFSSSDPQQKALNRVLISSVITQWRGGGSLSI